MKRRTGRLYDDAAVTVSVGGDASDRRIAVGHSDPVSGR
jgi:hypothetical protein